MHTHTDTKTHTHTHTHHCAGVSAGVYVRVCGRGGGKVEVCHTLVSAHETVAEASASRLARPNCTSDLRVTVLDATLRTPCKSYVV